jgi:hypothetical protein
VKTHRIAAIVLTPVALLALSGCGTHAGVSATVDGTKISTSDVDLLTRVQCDGLDQAQGSSGATTTPVAVVRQQALNGLIDSVLNEKFAAAKGGAYDKAAYRAEMNQVEQQLLTEVPKNDQDQMRAVIAQFDKGQLQAQEIGRRELLKQGVAKPSADEDLNAAYTLRADWAKALKITVDPAYAPGKSGLPGTGDRSVSKPISDFAKQGVASQPATTWADGLPKVQKCC